MGCRRSEQLNEVRISWSKIQVADKIIKISKSWEACVTKSWIQISLISRLKPNQVIAWLHVVIATKHASWIWIRIVSEVADYTGGAERRDLEKWLDIVV